MRHDPGLDCLPIWFPGRARPPDGADSCCRGTVRRSHCRRGSPSPSRPAAASSVVLSVSVSLFGNSLSSFATNVEVNVLKI